jgi:hypothetical protein
MLALPRRIGCSDRSGVVRCDENNTREVASVATWIAGQQRQLRHSCMGADKKIGQHSGPATTASAITLKHLAGEKQRGAWNLYELKPTADKRTINGLDTRVADRELRINMARPSAGFCANAYFRSCARLSSSRKSKVVGREESSSDRKGQHQLAILPVKAGAPRLTAREQLGCRSPGRTSGSKPIIF